MPPYLFRYGVGRFHVAAGHYHLRAAFRQLEGCHLSYPALFAPVMTIVLPRRSSAMAVSVISEYEEKEDEGIPPRTRAEGDLMASYLLRAGEEGSAEG